MALCKIELLRFLTKKSLFNINLMKADLNLDQIINILDILAVVNIILDSNSSSTVFQLFKCDLNTDGEINIADVISMISLILQ